MAVASMLEMCNKELQASDADAGTDSVNWELETLFTENYWKVRLVRGSDGTLEIRN